MFKLLVLVLVHSRMHNLLKPSTVKDLKFVCKKVLCLKQEREGACLASFVSLICKPHSC